MKKVIREIHQMVESEGCKVVDITGSKHYKVIVAMPNGRRFTTTFAMSPSCSRTAMNRKHQLRRQVREMTSLPNPGLTRA